MFEEYYCWPLIGYHLYYDTYYMSHLHLPAITIYSDLRSVVIEWRYLYQMSRIQFLVYSNTLFIYPSNDSRDLIWGHIFDSLRFENGAPGSYLGHLKIWPWQRSYLSFLFINQSEMIKIWSDQWKFFCRFWSVPPCYCFTACDSCPKLSIFGPIKFPAGKLLSCTTHLLH